MKGSARRLLVTSFVLASAWVSQPPARADDDPGFSNAGQAEVATASGPAPADTPAASDSSGGMVTTVNIVTPPLRSHAPRVSLTYDSSNNEDGPLGVGWQLQATSRIRRTSPGFGIPRYDDSDIFVLDGTEL